MTENPLTQTVREAIANALENGYKEILSYSDEELAGDLYVYSGELENESEDDILRAVKEWRRESMQEGFNKVLYRLRRSAELSADIMRNPKRTGGWAGSERTARAFDRLAQHARQAEALAKEPDPSPDEFYTDENGTVWERPTAWAYFVTCRALHKKNNELGNIEYMMALEVDENKLFRALLMRCKEREYNAFEPDNQSQLYHDIAAALQEKS